MAEQVLHGSIVLLFIDSSLQLINIMSWQRFKNATFKMNLRFSGTNSSTGDAERGGLANLPWAG